MNKFRLYFSNGDEVDTELEAKDEREAVNEELLTGDENLIETDLGLFNLSTLVCIQKIEGENQND